MNNRGWIRIAEALISILLIVGILLFVSIRRAGDSKSGKEIITYEESLLKYISSDTSLRGAVILEDYEVIRTAINEKIPRGFGFEIKICRIEEVCSLGSYKDEVYAKSVIISSDIHNYSPKKLTLFMWKEK